MQLNKFYANAPAKSVVEKGTVYEFKSGGFEDKVAIMQMQDGRVCQVTVYTNGGATEISYQEGPWKYATGSLRGWWITRNAFVSAMVVLLKDDPDKLAEYTRLLRSVREYTEFYSGSLEHKPIKTEADLVWTPSEDVDEDRPVNFNGFGK